MYYVHILLGSVLITLTGASMHFIYHWSGCHPLAAVFCAVNESTWEHIKIMLFPMLLWWLLTGSRGVEWAVWVSLAVLLAGNALSLALGFESLAYDIGLFFVSIGCGQSAGEWAEVDMGGWLSVLPVVALLFTFTFFPPHWEYMFYDYAHGRYGMPVACEP